MKRRERRWAKARATAIAAKVAATQAEAERELEAHRGHSVRVTHAGATSRFRAVCSIGDWRGPKRLLPQTAAADGQGHLAEILEAAEELLEYGTYEGSAP